MTICAQQNLLKVRDDLPSRSQTDSAVSQSSVHHVAAASSALSQLSGSPSMGSFGNTDTDLGQDYITNTAKEGTAGTESTCTSSSVISKDSFSR